KQKDKEAIIEYNALIKLKEGLEDEEKPARAIEFNEEEEKIVRGLHLLTNKPILYVANVSEDDITDPKTNEHVNKVKDYASEEDAEVIIICAKIEEEISELDPEEKDMFLDELGISESGLYKLINACYYLSGLGNYFKESEQEVRNWTIKKGKQAQQAEDIIHTDCEKGLNRAETVTYDDLLKAGSMAKAR